MDNKSSTEEERELCIVCGAVTNYKKTDHIDTRTGYIEGSGQHPVRLINYNTFSLTSI